MPEFNDVPEPRGPREHIVGENESLISIAAQLGIPVKVLLQLNPDIERGMSIEVGQAIRIPRPGRIDAINEAGNGLPQPEGPPRDPGVEFQDPAFNAFLREFGLNIAQIKSNRRAAVERLQSQFNRNIPVYADQRQQAEENTNYDFGGRGMYFSGGREKAITDAQTRIDRNQAIEEQTMLDNVADTRMTAGQDLAEWRRRRAEERLAARERQTILQAEMATGQA